MAKYSAEELNSLSSGQLVSMVLSLQDQVEKMNHNFEALIEQIRLADQQRFGRHTERLDEISGQMSLFNEVEAYADDSEPEPSAEEVICTSGKKKKTGKREEDFKDLPHEEHSHLLSDEQLDEHFGRGCWRRMKQEKFIRVRCQPSVYTVENHTVDVAVGTGGDHQDEFLRGDRPADLLRNSILTPSLMAAIYNSKYLNHQPLYRIENQFRMDGVNISRQTMANWCIRVAQKYLDPLYERLREELLKRPVTQADETPVQVIHDNDPEDPSDHKGAAGHKNWMWVHRTSELDTSPPIILYEYQRTRHHNHPLEYYRNYKGIVMTDGLQQYHMLEDLLDGFINANCWTHARRMYADAVKAIGKNSPDAVRKSLAFQALARIGAIFDMEGKLKNLSPEERLRERKKSVEPLVDEYFAWIKQKLSDTGSLPRGKTAGGMNYSIHQEKYLRVFLTDPLVPVDNSASERSIRPFTVGRKNWVLIDSVNGAKASAVVYSVVETARQNGLNCYRYFEHLLTELPELADENGNIDSGRLDPLLPWSDKLPELCRAPRR